MNKLLGVFTLLVLAFPALGCDEACQRDRASVNHNVEFPGYLSWKFCEDTKLTFMENDVPSLERYRQERLDIEYKVRMRNIKRFVEQRKEWLSECDNYFELTNHGRIFKDEETTDQIFAAMNEVATQLDNAIKGITYVASEDQDKSAIIGAKFDSLFKLVNDHKTLMMLKGQFVTN